MAQEKTNNVHLTELVWLNKQHDQGLPYRSDFSDLQADYQFLLERDELGQVKMRHVGFFVEALFGTSLAGREFRSLFPEQHNDVIDADLELLFSDPAKIYINAISPENEIQFGLMPVSEDYGPVNYALGAISLESVPQSSVVHLGLRSIEKISLRPAQKELKYGFAEGRQGFMGAPKRNFRVIEGGGQAAPSKGSGRFEAPQAKPGLQVIHNVKREP